jgi:L-malate glycosyltransferase
MRKIRVLHIIKSLGRGGAEMLLPETLKVHDQEKFEFHYIYFLPWKNQMVEAIQSNGGTITCFAANNNIQLLTKVRAVGRYVKEHGIQVIHAHLPWAGILARIVGKVTGIPVIYTEHNKQERYHIVTRLMNLFTMNWAKSVVAVSSDVEESIKKFKPRLKTGLQVILNGVNTAQFLPDRDIGKSVREKYGIPLDALVIGTVAVFRFQKRLDLWLEIAAGIHAEKKDVHFIIVGDGPLREMLYEKRKELQLEHVVHFAGLQTEVHPYFNAFNVYMMTSIFEGLPIALLEAMSCGLPIVSTTAGGVGEVVRDKQDGILCPVDKPESLKRNILTLLGAESLRLQYGRSARIRVEQDFSIQGMTRQIEALYLLILAP